MTVLKLNNQEAFEESQNVIDRREPFQLVVEGFTARMVRKLRPFYHSNLGPLPRGMTRIDALRLMIYAPWTGSFAAIYYAASKAGMVARWEDTGASLLVSFEMRE